MKHTNKKEALAEAQRLLKEPYSRNLIPDENGGFSASIVEFNGCFAEGGTVTEAYEKLEATAESWLMACLECGQDIPRPIVDYKASGRFLLRLPRSTHQRATKAAALEGTSLNSFIANAVSERLGATVAISRRRAG